MLESPLPDRSTMTRRRALDQRRRLRRASLKRSDRRRPSRRTRFALRFLGAFVLLIVSGTIAGLFALDHAYAGRIMPNVAIYGLDVSQMEPVDARQTLEQHHASFLRTPVTFEFGGQTWQPEPDQLGMTIEFDTAISQAYGLGRGLDTAMILPQIATIWRHGVEVPLRVTIDQHKLQAYLLNLAESIQTPPEDATLSVDMGQVIATSSRDGRQLLVDATVQDTLAALQTLQPQTISVRTRLLKPTIGDTGIAEAQQQLEALLQGPLTLTAGDREWTWTRADLGTLVQMERIPLADGAGDQILVSFDEETLAVWIQQIADEINAYPVEPRARFTDSGLTIIREGRNGAQLEIDQAREQIWAALWQEERALALPVTVLQPRVRPETLASLGIVKLVGQGKSSFLNSAPYRVTNIQAGASQMDGVLIAPGEEFSFNQTIGAINAANGFTRGYAIINGRTELEWGGGVCQVSTTVFRAAYWSGLPITERHQHTYRIEWYEKFEPVGMDAAIFTGPGGYDMRFINDTGNWLLLETYADIENEVLTINLYGTNPGRQVTQTPPDVSYNAGVMNVSVGRTITGVNGAVVHQDSFFSSFKPWPNS